MTIPDDLRLYSFKHVLRKKYKLKKKKAPGRKKYTG